MYRTKLLAVALAIAALAQVGSAQDAPQAPPPPEAPRPTFRTDINFVRVDVIVTEKGEPVTNLTEADFEMQEDGKPVKVVQFRLVRVDGRPRAGDPPPRQIRSRDDEEAEAQRDDTRVIAIFLDDYHTRLGNGMSMRRQLAEFINTQLQPTDMVAVMYPLTPVSALQFTRNHASIVSAVNNFEGRKFRYQARNPFEAEYERQPTEVVEQMRNQVVMTALRGLATRLGSIREGRKAVIYVSEGLTVMLPPQLRRGDASNPLVGGTRNPMAGENSTTEDRARFMAQSDLYYRLRDVFADFNRHNTSIYALDPKGLATNEFGIDENVGPQQDRESLQITTDTLRSLSEETDGRAIVSRNDLARGLQQLIRDSSYYYLLGYTSQAATDGKFHDIKVNVRRRGVDVRARRGFWAATADDVTRATTAAPVIPKPVENALATLSSPAAQTNYVRTWIGTDKGDNGRTRVTFVWEPVAGPPGARREQPGRVQVTAATASGNLLYRGRTPEQPPANAAAGAAVPPQRITFDAPPGPIELRLSVEAATGGLLDNDIRRFTVPDLTAPQVSISTPRLFRARTVRDLQAVAQNGAAIPSTVREFSRTERVLIRFDAYAAGGEVPTVTAVLLNRGGQKISDVAVAAATAAGTHQIDLGLNAVPPAEYVVEITVKSGSGETREYVPLRVVS